jgi:hypothetical protein
MMDHDTAARCQIVDDLKGVELVGNVLGRAEIGHQLIFAQRVVGNRIAIEIKGYADRAAVYVDRGVVESQPAPKLRRRRRFLREKFCPTFTDTPRSRLRQRAR